VERNYFEGVEHYHASNGTCTINSSLGTGGVPHVALVDGHGKIVFKGHPMSCDLEKVMTDLCEGKEAPAQNADAPKGRGEEPKGDIE